MSHLADAPSAPPTRLVVLDTHIALDVCLFDDPRDLDLRRQLQQAQARWTACTAMREEFARVLTYPKVQRAVAKFWGEEALAQRVQIALQRFDDWAHMVAAAPRAPVRCTDADDQIFIDLACAHGTELISRDAAVLKAWRRCRRMGLGAPDWLPTAVKPD